MLMLAPLVIPGVILGISILAFASRVAEFADDVFGLEVDFLRPGLPLVVLGQFSYIATIATLTISARLRRFDRTLEEAALNLGASRPAVLRTIIFPYLRPALLGSAAISFLMSFADFNTTLMLVGADSPLTVMMYGRMREGASPVLNAVSLFLMLASACLRSPSCAAVRRAATRQIPGHRNLAEFFMKTLLALAAALASWVPISATSTVSTSTSVSHPCWKAGSSCTAWSRSTRNSNSEGSLAAYDSFPARSG